MYQLLNSSMPHPSIFVVSSPDTFRSSLHSSLSEGGETWGWILGTALHSRGEGKAERPAPTHPCGLRTETGCGVACEDERGADPHTFVWRGDGAWMRLTIFEGQRLDERVMRQEVTGGQPTTGR